MKFSVNVENIKCGGCANGIKAKLSTLNSVSSVFVDVDAGIVSVESTDSVEGVVKDTLLRLGYPEVGSVKGIKSASAKAKSFVSCAVGTMTDK